LSGSIQNSLFSFKNNYEKINNFNFQNVLRKFENNIYSIKFNAEVFPAMFLRPALKYKKMGFPTILLFTSGSFVIIGGKTMEYIKKAHTLALSLINNKL
jgi:TATA-box binding protein (TBP) (component of TFIID and TFIIIB)